MTLLPSAFHFTTPGPSSSPIPPPGTPLIISDTPGASSDFCVYSLVASCVRERVKVTIVDFGSRGRLHWEGVGKKIVSISFLSSSFLLSSICRLTHVSRWTFQGTPLPPKSSPLLCYLAPSPDSLFDPSTDEPSLAQLWDDLITSSPSSNTRERNNSTPQATPSHKPENTRGIVVLVGFSEMIWQGFEPELLSRFSRALLAVCRSVCFSSHSRHFLYHTSDTDPDLPSLLRYGPPNTERSTLRPNNP